jgi:putative Mn2+ efflux pump MntP
MSTLTLFFVALGLAMDSFAVSVASGATERQLNVRSAMRIAAFFGGFQAVMPFIGWLAGLSLKNFISNLDHWVVFGLLGLIGGRMIYESTKLRPDDRSPRTMSIHVLVLLAIATSIDAFAVGISFAFLRVSIVTPLMVIGAVTFLLSFAGTYIGNRVGHLFENKIEALGGLILIGIGVKILLEHTVLRK